MTRGAAVLGVGAVLGALLGASTFAVPRATAVEIVPSVGLTRSVDGDDTNKSVGLALRGSLVPGVLKSEIGASYRSEDQFNGDLKLKMWPVTASVLLTPIPTLYGSAGVGWYHTTFDYDESLPIKDETKEEFGVHLGGGLRIPLAPAAAIDLGGRYVMMRDQESKLVPAKFNPDFWTLSLGLALGL